MSTTPTHISPRYSWEAPPPSAKAPVIALPLERIAEFCREQQIQDLAVFGSVLREDFRPESDIDFLVTFSPAVRLTIDRLMEFEEGLAQIIGRKVDIVERGAVEKSKSTIRRGHILSTAVPIYVA